MCPRETGRSGPAVARRNSRCPGWLVAAWLLTCPVVGGGFSILSGARDGEVRWGNAFTAGVVTVEVAPAIDGPWACGPSHFTTGPEGGARFGLLAGRTFCRLAAVDLSTNTPGHYANLLESYGVLETVAGRGQYNADRVSFWSNGFEGGWATNANLSRPHIAFGDPWGNVLIVDQGSSSVLKVTPEGRIHTLAGTHVAGNNGDGPAAATNLQLNFPNGGWMRADGTFYVLDTENGKVRRISTNGVMSTMFTTSPMGDGRALWVRSDEAEVYFGSGAAVGANVTVLNRWTPTGGVQVVSSSFGNLGNLVGDEVTGELYLTDRTACRVYRLGTNGVLNTIAGNGTVSGGGEGSPATETGLVHPRTICRLCNGGFLVGEHDSSGGAGNRIWYVDPAGIIHRWMSGDDAGNATVNRRGDGQWFYAEPAMPKLTKVRSVTMDPAGNLLIVESNYGFVRRIRFQRLKP